jgi:hypothetical protein
MFTTATREGGVWGEERTPHSVSSPSSSVTSALLLKKLSPESLTRAFPANIDALVRAVPGAVQGAGSRAPHPCPFGKLRALSLSKGGTGRFSCPATLARGARWSGSLPPSLFELRRTSRARSCRYSRNSNRLSSGRLAGQRKSNQPVGQYLMELL